MTRHVPLTKLLAERMPALEDAEGAIERGEIHVDGVMVLNPRARVDQAARVTHVPPKPLRGELKLAAAIDAMSEPVRIEGAVALDVGACTGGFTTELLRRGARLVYAVDVGVGQLLGALRQDPRVVNLETTNAASLSTALVPEAIDVVTVDVSYTPLATVTPQFSSSVTMQPGAVLLALVKPMFELQLGSLPATDAEFDVAVERAAAGIEGAGWSVRETIRSPVLGAQGATEFWVRAIW